MTTHTVDVSPQPAWGTRMRARAHLVTELRSTACGPARNCVSTLRSEAPLMLRITRAKSSDSWAAHLAGVARVALTAGAAGPVGGDRLELTVEVGAGSALVLSEISPTLLLPGPHGEQSRTTIRVRVAAGGTLIWLPEPMIAARGCDHVHDVAVDLAEDARFFMREEVLLGRHGETGGQVTQRVSVRLAGHPLYRQDLQLGTASAATPAVLATHRAVGSAMVVDPSWAAHPPRGHRLDGDAAVLPLEGPAVLITALGLNNLELRSRLDAGLTELGVAWSTGTEAKDTNR
jgi:urease accessory protein